MSKRLRLSSAQKAAIIEEQERRDNEGHTSSLTTMALWAKQQFRLDVVPSLASISRTLSEKEQPEEPIQEGESEKKKQRIENSDATMKRVRLNSAQKALVIAEQERREKERIASTHSAMAQWAKEQFQLEVLPSNATISRILHGKAEIEERIQDGYSDRKKRPTLKSDALEAALVECIWDLLDRNVNVSHDLIQEKGRRLLALVNNELPEERRIDMKFSNGWLHKFKQRNRFKRLRLIKKEEDAKPAIIPGSPSVQERLKQYAPKDIWNADEFGLFYMFGVTDLIGLVKISGRKKQHQRLTFLACTNGDGTEKFPLAMIGKARSPRCFDKRTGRDLGFDYHQNAKAWMNRGIFFEWLERFNKYIGTTSGRKVALLVDNASCHGKERTLPELAHVEVIFLPRHRTQPVHLSVVSALKRRYRYRQISRALDGIEDDASKMFKVDQLTAMRWMREIWNELTNEVIHDSWCDSGFLNGIPEGSKTVQLSSLAKTEEKELKELLDEVLPNRGCVYITDLLNPEGEDDCTAETSEQSLAEDVLHNLNEQNGTPENNIKKEKEKVNVDDDFVEDDITNMSHKQQIEHLGYAMRILERREVIPPTFRSFVNAQKSELRKELRKSIELRKNEDRKDIKKAL